MHFKLKFNEKSTKQRIKLEFIILGVFSCSLTIFRRCNIIRSNRYHVWEGVKMASFFERVTDLMQKDGGIYMPKEGISELIDIKAEKKKKKGKLAYEDIAEIAGVSLQTI